MQMSPAGPPTQLAAWCCPALGCRKGTDMDQGDCGHGGLAHTTVHRPVPRHCCVHQAPTAVPLKPGHLGTLRAPVLKTSDATCCTWNGPDVAPSRQLCGPSELRPIPAALTALCESGRGTSYLVGGVKRGPGVPATLLGVLPTPWAPGSCSANGPGTWRRQLVI